MTPRGEKYPAGVLIAYYLTLAAFFVASFYPQYRVWGISWWAYFPLWVKLGLLALGAVAPFAADRLVDKLLAGRDDITPKTYRWLVGGFAVTMTALFYLLRARTHFLGDGYTLLRLLGSDNPFIKPRNLGGTIFQYWIFKFTGGTSEADALLAYQIVSIGAGILFLAIAIWSAAKLVPNRLSRLLFVLSVSTGGYVLLYFGYVENYSLFSVAVFAYTVTILLISSESVNRWWIVLAQGIVIFLHIFGVVLLPATLYLLLYQTMLWRRLTQLGKPIKVMLGLVLATVSISAFAYAYSKSFFFRLSLLPIVTNEFTVEGYTLLSFPHLIDLANLLSILFPGIAVGLAAVIVHRRDGPADLGKFVHITLAVSGTVGAALIFSPGLGMPRDWDLFSLTGIPLLVATVYTVCQQPIRTAARTGILIIVTGMMLLLPRSYVFSVPEMSIRHIEAYTETDIAKSGTARYLLSIYLKSTGDSTRARVLDSVWFYRDPDSYLMNATVDDRVHIDTVSLMGILRRCTRNNPLNWTAWGNIGVLALRQKAFDSALYYLQISDGLNPYNPTTNLNMGYAYFNLRDYVKAEKHIKEAVHLDTALLTTSVLMLFADLYRESFQEDKYIKTFGQIADRPDSPPKYVMGWIQLLLSQGDYPAAAQRIKRAVGIQIDSAYVRELLLRYPLLQEAIQR